MSRGKQYLLAVGGGLLSVLFLLLAQLVSISVPQGLSVLPFFFTCAPVYAVGFTQGRKSAIISVLAATVALTALSQDSTSAAGIIVLLWFPAILFIHLMLLSRRDLDQGQLEWYPVGRLLCWMVSVGSPALAFTFFFMTTQLLENDLLASIKLLAKEGNQSGVLMPSESEIRWLVDVIISLLPSASVIAWMLFHSVSMYVGTLFARTVGGLRPFPDLHKIALPYSATIVMGISIFAGLMGSETLRYFAFPITAGLAVAHLFAGLSTVHALTRNWPNRIFVLASLYFALLFAPGVALLLIFSVLDSIFDLRRKYHRKPS